MKKLIILLFVIGVLSVILGSCGECSHSWSRATCEKPSECVLCGEISGEALAHRYSPATCTKAPTCTLCGTVNGEMALHNYSEATCTQPKTCIECGTAEGEALEHNYSEATCTRAAVCKECGAKKGEKLPHDLREATCTQPKTCIECGTTEGEALEHNYSEATCTRAAACKECGAKKGEKLPHDLGEATCTQRAKCKNCGAEEGQLAEHDLTEPTCQERGVCRVCGTVDGGYGQHDLGEATCVRLAQCKVCGDRFGDYGDHVFAPATCKAPATCTECGETEGELDDHVWQGSVCLENYICAVCGISGDVIEHVYIEATCTEPSVCTRCNVTAGEAKGHTWSEDDCTQLSHCTVCNFQSEDYYAHQWTFVSCDTPMYCKKCKQRQSEPAGHTIVEATCERSAYCTACKKSQGKALGHSWATDFKYDEDNHWHYCTRCEKSKGDEAEHTWVYFETIAPSCKDGAEVYICGCAGTRAETITATIDHHACDRDGLCKVCDIQFNVDLMRFYALSPWGSDGILRQGVFLTTETPTKIHMSVTNEDLGGMPIIDLNGDISALTGKGPVANVSFVYSEQGKDFECVAQLSVQGASSAGYAKKNYSVKLYEEDGSKNKVKLKDNWGKQFKYCLKANWVDYSQARNVVSGQLYGDVIATRDVIDELTDLPSGGAIDGYPVVVFNNGQFLGLYTMNIPKDKWMFDMEDSDEKNQAIVMADQWGNSVAMREEIAINENDNWKYSSYWELEYASNEDSLIDNNTTWVAKSLNELIKFVMNNDGEAFKNGIHRYADVDKCIDSMLHTFFICADDNISKNILWVTYDGTTWFSSVYDMDGTWGMQWNGNLSFKDANTHLISVLASHNNNRYNLLWEKIYLNFFDKVVERYWELRQSVYNMEHITARFTAFFDQIPEGVRAAERAKWSGVPSQTTNNLAQILEFARLRIEKMDKILIK